MNLETFKAYAGTGGDFLASWRIANDVARCELGQTATVFQRHSAVEARLEKALSTAVEAIGRRRDDVLSVAEALREQRRLDFDGFKKAPVPAPSQMTGASLP